METVSLTFIFGYQPMVRVNIQINIRLRFHLIGTKHKWGAGLI